MFSYHLLQGYTYNSGVMALCIKAPPPPDNANTLSVVATIPISGAAGTSTISASQLASAIAAIIQQYGAGSPIRASQAANGPANATAVLQFNNQVDVDNAVSALQNNIDNLIAAAGLPPGSTITILGGMSGSGPAVYSCLPVPASQKKQVCACPCIQLFEVKTD